MSFTSIKTQHRKSYPYSRLIYRSTNHCWSHHKFSLGLRSLRYSCPQLSRIQLKRLLWYLMWGWKKESWWSSLRSLLWWTTSIKCHRGCLTLDLPLLRWARKTSCSRLSDRISFRLFKSSPILRVTHSSNLKTLTWVQLTRDIFWGETTSSSKRENFKHTWLRPCTWTSSWPHSPTSRVRHRANFSPRRLCFWRITRRPQPQRCRARPAA